MDAKARRGELRNFTGIDSPYEVPQAADLYLHASVNDTAGMAEQVIARLGQDWRRKLLLDPILFPAADQASA